MKNAKLLIFAQIFSLVILSFFLLLLTIYKPLNQDEGVFLTIGKFLGAGVLPYRDIFDHKPPGIYFLNYLILAVFNNFIFVKTIFFLINILSAALVVKIYRRISNQARFVYLPAIFFLLTLIIFEGNYLLAEIPMIFCLLLALYLLLSDRKYFWVGFFCGLAIIFKQTALVSSLFILILAGSKNKKNIFGLLAGFLLPLLFVIFYLIFNNILAAGFNQIFTLNICCYPRESFLFVIKKLMFYFFHALPILLLAFWGSYNALKNYRSEKKGLPIFLLLILPIPFLLIRHYPHYWIQILPFLAILAAVGVERLLCKKNLWLNCLIFISIIIMAISNFRWLFWQFKNNYIEQYEEQNNVILYLEKHHYEMILAENQFSYVNFFNSRKPPIKYLYITEVNSANNQAENETIELLRQNKNIVVLWPENENFAYGKKLQQYIFENYQRETIFPSLGLVIYKYN